ncbi:hypothetical protein [Vibrio atlanticus]|uniref:hypothetical protein n=1 Tax=Vibrio atlanticus TaxID=693153 RepID=UPI003D142723
MGNKDTANNGYQPQRSPSDITKGYQPTRSGPAPVSPPGAGYQPTGTGSNPTSQPKPPGAE